MKKKKKVRWKNPKGGYVYVRIYDAIQKFGDHSDSVMSRDNYRNAMNKVCEEMERLYCKSKGTWSDYVFDKTL